MALVTSFSLKEMDYLRGLPEKTWPAGTSIAEQINVVQSAWGRPAVGVTLNPLWRQCAEHDTWGHNHDGWAFYRHGDMLAKMPCPNANSFMTAQEEAELLDWLAAIHTHEAAAR